MGSIFLWKMKSEDGPRTVCRLARLQTQWRVCQNSNGAHPWTNVPRTRVPMQWHSTQAGTIGQCSVFPCRRIEHASAKLCDYAETLPAAFDTTQACNFEQRPYKLLTEFN